MTFSIVAADLDAGEWGVAVASKFLAAGSVVPWARAGVGALATQAYANIGYGPAGLDLLERRPASEVVDRLIAPDDGREHRQLGVVDAAGTGAAFTGGECTEWAGHLIGDVYTCQGNILTGADVLREMAGAFEAETADLTSKLLAALAAGDGAGGDRRGRQSAAVLVVRTGGGYLGETDVAVDLRVDDHPAPVAELARLVSIHGMLFPNPATLDFVEVDEDLARRLASALSERGFPVDAVSYSDQLKGALFSWIGTENLEMRWSEGAEVEREILRQLHIEV